MGREEQLQWERRWAPYAAGAAFLAAALSLAAFIYQRSITPAPKNVAQFLVSLDAQSGKYLLDTILSALGAVALAPVLVYLYRATKFRRAVVPNLALILAIAAPIAYGGLVIATSANQVSIAHNFVRDDPGAKTVVVGQKTVKKEDDRKGSVNDRAKDKISASGVLAGISIASTLAFAIAFVLICLNAMRAGLLSRFMGSLGMVIGALYIFQVLIPPAIVELFWLPALGLIFLDKWPQGRGPAWEAAEEVPWPSAQDRRAAAAGVEPPQRPARPAGRGGGGLFGGLLRPPAPKTPAEPAEAEEAADEDLHTREAARPRASAQHPRSKKRKRKRRG